MENTKLIDDEPELIEDESELVPVIRVVPDPLGRRVLNFFTGLPSLIPAVKRRRERKHWVEYREHRREFWRAAMREVEVTIRTKRTGADPDDWEIDEDSKYQVEADIKYVKTKRDADLSRINARIDAIDFRRYIKTTYCTSTTPDSVLVSDLELSPQSGDPSSCQQSPPLSRVR
jgi:hypothetical protein